MKGDVLRGLKTSIDVETGEIVVHGFKTFLREENGELYTQPMCKKFYYNIDFPHIHDGEVVVGSSGFHFSRDPYLGVFYYPKGGVTHHIEARGTIKADGNIYACSNITIKERFTFSLENVRNFVGEKLETLEAICIAGHLDVLQWYIEEYGGSLASLSKHLFRLACHYEQLHVAEWLLDRYAGDIDKSVLDDELHYASDFGNVRCLEWLKSL